MVVSTHRLSGDEVFGQCPHYILHQHHPVGCILEAGDDVLEFSILNGTQPLLSRSLWTSTYLKPSSPKDVNFLWDNEAVTITCSEVAYEGLLYEIQYRSNFDAEWQPKEEETCNIIVEGLDDEKCYYFRARVKTKESSYGSHTYPSDWSEVSHWQGGQIKDFCPQEEKPFPKYILISSLVALLTLSLLLLSLWKLQRVKKLLMPIVPDPKYSFPGLFEDHRGNFQEWIRDTQNVSSLNKTEGKEKECVLEDVLVAQLVQAEVDKPTISRLSMQTGEEEAEGSEQLPDRPLQGGDVVSLGGFRFVMSDNAYMML
nr:cytokine receptor-like factor 2 [Dasypus novemcinctus]